jgi:hypothetical protein
MLSTTVVAMASLVHPERF